MRLSWDYVSLLVALSCASQKMFFKTLIVVLLAVGTLAQFQVTDEMKEQLKNTLTNYCTKNGAADKATDAQQAITTYVDCLKNLFDIATIQKEIEEAKPNGALDEVFKKYCAKTPELKVCLDNVLTGLEPCMDPTIREHVTDIKNGTSQLLDFVCYKDGDRIALFYAENGTECFREKMNELRECAQALQTSIPSVEAAKTLTLTEQCAKYDETTACMVRALEGCSTPTPGNMAESLFRYIRKSTPCGKK